MRGKAIARDGAWTLAGQLVRIGAQAAAFLLLARALGVREFGALAAALAIAAIAVPFAGWGGGNLLVMRTAREPAAFREAFGASLMMILVSGGALCVLCSAAATGLIAGVSVALAVEIALADLVFARVAETCALAFQGFGRLRTSAGVSTIPAVARLGAAAGFVWQGGSTTSGWGGWYLGSSIASAAVASAFTTAALGRPLLATRVAIGQWKDGLLFAVGASSATIYNDIDKTMVARLATLGAAGAYAAASRAVGMAFTPVLALMTAAYYRFFVQGAEGIRGTVDLARRLLPGVLALGTAAAAALWFAAPLAPRVLGSGFADAEPALRWLAAVPLLQAAFYLAGDVLTGAGHQGLRCATQVGAAGLNVLLNLWLIPVYSWRGAAAATIATDAALAATLWLIVAGLARRSRPLSLAVAT